MQELIDDSKIDIKETISGVSMRVCLEKKPDDMLLLVVALPFLCKDITVHRSWLREKLQTLMDWLDK